MNRYKFEQFKIEVVDPTIEINMESIIFNYVAGKASVGVTLTTPNGSKFGVFFEDMPINDPDLNNVDISAMVDTKLQEYLVV